MDRDFWNSIWFWIGVLVFGFLNWQVNWSAHPQGFVQCLGVGAWIAGSILFFIELGWCALQDDLPGFDRGFLGLFTLGAIALAMGLVWHAITSGQVWIIASLVVGAFLYLVLLRMPFMALVRT